MPYEGEELNECPANMFDFSRTVAVVVSGSWPNAYGHMLLNTGGKGGAYFQVAGVVTRPRWMDEAGYRLYLKENDKTELRRIPVYIPHPERSQLKLEQILSESWTWGAVVHNCETLVEEIVVAGGGPVLHRGLLSLPSEAGWSAWDCGARACPGHRERKHRCASGVWVCRRSVPGCPGHSSPEHECGGGASWSCGADRCPTHSDRRHRCATGSWKCRRRVPPCPGHGSPEHRCSEAG